MSSCHLRPADTPLFHLVCEQFQIFIIERLVFIHLEIALIGIVIDIGLIFLNLLLGILQLFLRLRYAFLQSGQGLIVYFFRLLSCQERGLVIILCRNLILLIFDGSRPVRQISASERLFQFFPNLRHAILREFQNLRSLCNLLPGGNTYLFNHKVGSKIFHFKIFFRNSHADHARCCNHIIRQRHAVKLHIVLSVF